ncbi:hypothetical protein M408DRAFT_15274 [Serendipita vermifera MAFF 305830]|uniref:Uncharacterized protein n=1 Tax=Serendipita vermifera MAFF 305830 TaxID=933852 RepID=A0A0C2XPB9_SERVB|nr:hypothetical protein M408DRAFT_15274 [Serendipita vermifera MAFF 305830]
MSSISAPLHPLSSAKIHDLSGLVALVTGGGSGIGLMIAETLACNGAKVYIASRRLETLQKAATDVNGRLAAIEGHANGSLVPIVLDVTSKPSIQEAVAHLREKEGKLHILVNNSGQVGPFSRILKDANPPGDLGKAVFESETFEEWSALFNVNLASIFFTTFAFLSLLEDGAKDLDERFTSHKHSTSVINISSISGIQRQGQAHYAYNVSKAGVNHMTKMMSTEFAIKKKPVRVNAIAPGAYASEMTDHQGKQMEPWVVDAICQGLTPHPLQRPGREEEIGAAALLLASPTAGGYMNGQVLVVDGGFLAVNPA